jgi:hypothetical protein
LGVGLVREADAVFGEELTRLGVPRSLDGLTAVVDLVFTQLREAIARGELGYVAIVSVA